MNYIYAVILGLVQGVAEFLPISSSGHLALFSSILGMESLAELDGNATFNILLHLATLLAVVIAYWSDVKSLVTEFFAVVKNIARRESVVSGDVPTRRLILMLIIATLPLFVISPFHKVFERLSSIPWFVGAMIIVTGTVLFIADRMPKGTKTDGTITVWDVIVVGLAQGFATIPGLSRSGLTISAGIGRGFERNFAVRFSFLMSMLAVLGAVGLKAIDLLGEAPDVSLIPLYLVGMAVAFVTGYYSIRFLQKIISKGRFGGFAYYCWGVGALSIVLSLILGT